jgi:hypothetical protein
MSSCTLKSLSMLVTMISSSRRLYKLYKDMYTRFSIGVISVMSPCTLQSLSMLVTTLSCTRFLCKLSLDVCTLFNIGVSSLMSHCSLQSLSNLVTTLNGEASFLQAVVGRVLTVHCRNLFRPVTLLATVTISAGDHAEWHSSSAQAVVVRMHIAHYRSHFRHVT